MRSLLILCVLVGAVAVVAALIGRLITPYSAPAASGAALHCRLLRARIGGHKQRASDPAGPEHFCRRPSRSSHPGRVDAGLAGNIDPVSSFANLLGPADREPQRTAPPEDDSPPVGDRARGVPARSALSGPTDRASEMGGWRRDR